MIVQLNQLTKTINGSTVLDNINLNFHSGCVYGLKGKNGSGKTMLMRAICGLILPTKGSITIDNEILGKDISFPRSVGVLIENPAFIDSYTGFKNLKLIASIRKIISDSEIAETLQLVGLDPLDKRKYKKYSLGMKQRLGIACAIMESPEIVILDEPTNALDEKGIILVREILQRCREKNELVILSCHDSDEMNLLADEIYLMSDGKIIEKSKEGNAT